MPKGGTALNLNKPKYRLLADDLRERILQGHTEGDKLETENEMVARYGVSRQTVRHALSILENEGLIIRRQGSGIYVTEHRQGSQICPTMDKTITFISTYISDYVFPSIIRGAEEVLTGSGYTLKISQTQNRVELERKLLCSSLESIPTGMIIEGTKTAFPNPNIALYKKLQSAGVPMVFVNGFYQELNDSVYVITDDRKGGRDAVSYLLSLGHRNIGGIFKADDIQGHERYAGFAEGLVTGGADLIDERIVWFTTESIEQPLFADNGKFLIDKLSACSAVVCYNDQIAVRLIDLFMRKGIDVPRDKAVISFDNSVYSDISSVKITSLDHPKEDLGRAAANKLISMINGKKEEPLIMPFGFFEKESTAPVP